MKGIFCNFSDKVEILTPSDGYHYFYGYYDMAATPRCGEGRHLCHRVGFMDRLPLPDDVCELGFLEGGKFIKLAETTAWNFQQGALLSYFADRADTVHYNVFYDGAFRTAIHNFESGEIKYTDRPLAALSLDGKFGLSVNFGRIYGFRPGYGYSGAADEYALELHPAEDGVFLTDIASGSSRLILSYKDMLAESGFSADEKILVNHITFSKDGSRYLMLVRNMGEGIKKWSTSMMVGDLHGNVKTLIKCAVVSHYNWSDDGNILVFTTDDGVRLGLFLVDGESGEMKEIESFYFNGKGDTDIHCLYSPGEKFIIGDGYTQADGCRHLLTVNTETKESYVTLKLNSPPPKNTDVRCDLHARFVHGGKYVSMDTTFDGTRKVIMVPTECVCL